MLLEEGRFETLRETLLRGGVAPRHVRRYLAELEDHLADLTARERDAGRDPQDAATRARTALGDDTTLAAAMLAQPKLRSLTARAPWLTLGLLPPFVLLLAALLQVVVLGVTMRALGITGHHTIILPSWFYYFTDAAVLGGNLLVIPSIAALFVAIAWRQRLPLAWPLIGIAIILVLSLHWDSDPLIRDPHGWGAAGLTWRYSGQALRVGFTPVFLYAWWKAMAAHSLMLCAQYALIMLPLAWLVLARRLYGPHQCLLRGQHVL